MAMSLEDIYYDYPELQTDTEKHVHSDEFDYRACVPAFVRETITNEPLPDAMGKEEFDERKPAFGWTTTQIDELEKKAAMDPVHEYVLYDRVKEMMLRRLISTSGAGTVKELCAILKAELEANTTAPVPPWYKFSEQRTGPDFYDRSKKGRRFGYSKCERRDCTATEDLTTQFKQCSKCWMACYCSRDCQVMDWKERHKAVCKQAAKQGKMTAQAAAFQSMFM